MTQSFSILGMVMVFAWIPAAQASDPAIEQAHREHSKAQGEYFKSLMSSQARTPQERRKLRKQTLEPAAQKLSEALTPAPAPVRPRGAKGGYVGLSDEQSRQLAERINRESDTEAGKIAREAMQNPGAFFKSSQAGDALKGNFAESKKVPSPAVADAPEPELKVEGVEDKTVLEFKKRNKEAPTPATQIEFVETPGNSQDMSILEFARPSPRPPSKKSKR